MRPDIVLVLGGVGVVKGSIRDAGPVLVEVSKELNPFLVKSGFLQNAPFQLLNGIIRFGSKFSPEPDCEAIDKKHSELPFAVEVDLAQLRRARRDEVKAAFLGVLIPALLKIADKYDLPTTGIAAYCQERCIPLPS